MSGGRLRDVTPVFTMSHVAPSAHRISRFMVFAWLLIAAKCALVAWAVSRWDVPVSAGWVIWPTLVFGLLATGLWFSRGRD